jgi:hypothetical protein
METLLQTLPWIALRAAVHAVPSHGVFLAP